MEYIFYHHSCLKYVEIILNYNLHSPEPLVAYKCLWRNFCDVILLQASEKRRKLYQWNEFLSIVKYSLFIKYSNKTSVLLFQYDLFLAKPFSLDLDVFWTGRLWKNVCVIDLYTSLKFSIDLFLISLIVLHLLKIVILLDPLYFINYLSFILGWLKNLFCLSCNLKSRRKKILKCFSFLSWHKPV